jgi:tRNA U34 5-carboxymethylaminomethyl modifying enzyme MnmG/GidA
MIRGLIIVAAFALSACATAPAGVDKLTLAREVSRLTGETADVRAALTLVTPGLNRLLGTRNAGEECRRKLDKDAPAFARAACDAVEAALGLAVAGSNDLAKALDAQLVRMDEKSALALADTYSVSELSAMRRYYASPEGRAIVAKRAEYWRNLAARMADG